MMYSTIRPLSLWELLLTGVGVRTSVISKMVEGQLSVRKRGEGATFTTLGCEHDNLLLSKCIYSDL